MKPFVVATYAAVLEFAARNEKQLRELSDTDDVDETVKHFWDAVGKRQRRPVIFRGFSANETSSHEALEGTNNPDGNGHEPDVESSPEDGKK